MDVHIPVIIGTAREQRWSHEAAGFIFHVAHQIDGLSTELVDPKNFSFPGDGNDTEAKDERYAELLKRSDGLFLVVPEYNHSYPGSLKRLLDSELELYLHKAVGLAGVSSGSIGGARAIEALLGVVRELGMVTSFQDVLFPKVQDIFSTDRPIDLTVYERRVKKAWIELVWLTRAMKAASQA